MLYIPIILIILLELLFSFSFSNYFDYKYNISHLYVKKHTNTPNSLVSKEEFIETANTLGLPEKYIIQESEAIVEGKSKNTSNQNQQAKKPLKKRLVKFKDLLPEPGVIYPLTECIERLKVISKVDFIEGVDIVIRFALKPGKAKSKVENFTRLVSLPYKSLKSKRRKIAIFAPDDVAKKYNFEGADFIGEATLIDKFKFEKRPKIDVILTSVDVVHKLASIGKRLGSKRLMPSEVSGTLCNGWIEVENRLKLFRDFNTFTLSAESTGDIKCNVADLSMSSDEIRGNILALIKNLRNNKPPYTSKKFINKVIISSSMGPSYRLSLKEIGAI